MERKKFVICRSHFLLFMSILGICGSTEKEVDLEELNNELQVIRNLTVKLERDLDSYQVHHKQTSNNVDQFIEELHTFVSTENPLTKETLTFDDKNHVHQKTTLGNNKSKHWPTFEELLLLTNRKYDWKNDRWIKIKSAIKEKSNVNLTSTTKNPESIRNKFIFRKIRYDHNSSKHYIVAALPANPRH